MLYVTREQGVIDFIKNNFIDEVSNIIAFVEQFHPINAFERLKTIKKGVSDALEASSWALE